MNFSHIFLSILFYFVVALFLILVVSAVAFSLTLTLDLPQYVREFIVGLCFFISSVGSLLLYFGQKTRLLLSGAEMNGRFQVVRGSQVLKEPPRITGTQSVSSENSEPKTAFECEAQIKVLRTHLMKILAQDAYAALDEALPFARSLSLKRVPPAAAIMNLTRQSSKILPAYGKD